MPVGPTTNPRLTAFPTRNSHAAGGPRWQDVDKIVMRRCSSSWDVDSMDRTRFGNRHPDSLVLQLQGTVPKRGGGHGSLSLPSSTSSRNRAEFTISPPGAATKQGGNKSSLAWRLLSFHLYGSGPSMPKGLPLRLLCFLRRRFRKEEWSHRVHREGEWPFSIVLCSLWRIFLVAAEPL